MQNTIIEIKNYLEAANSRIQEAEERISEVEDRWVQITDAEQKREKRLKTNEESLGELWDNVKCTNICIIGVPEGEEREKETEKIFQEIIAENFPNVGKESLTQIQEAQRVPYKINPRRNTLRHILIKLTKIKDRENLESSEGKETNNIQGNPNKVIGRFFNRNSAGQKAVAWYTQRDERKKPPTKITLPSKALLHIWRRNQNLHR